jgi:hypothetical protein
MTQRRPPFPPREKTPAALAAYQLQSYYWDHSQHIAEDETLEVAFISPAREKLTIILAVPLDAHTLWIEAYGADGKRRLVFVPYVPAEFTFEVVKKGATSSRRIGFQMAPLDGPSVGSSGADAAAERQG